MQSQTKKLTILALFTAFALLCSYVESLIPFYFGVPGMKLGLTNIVVVLLLYIYGPKDAALVSVMRILLAAFLFGSAFSAIYSLAGAFLSLLVMMLVKRLSGISMIVVSMCGGIAHNLGQIIVAMLVVENLYLFGYFPFLFIGGGLTGLLIGIIAREIYLRTKKVF